jgi:hypothetical protein
VRFQDGRRVPLNLDRGAFVRPLLRPWAISSTGAVAERAGVEEAYVPRLVELAKTETPVVLGTTGV